MSGFMIVAGAAGSVAAAAVRITAHLCKTRRLRMLLESRRDMSDEGLSAAEQANLLHALRDGELSRTAAELVRPLGPDDQADDEPPTRPIPRVIAPPPDRLLEHRPERLAKWPRVSARSRVRHLR